jgi:hypothetical protein
MVILRVGPLLTSSQAARENDHDNFDYQVVSKVFGLRTGGSLSWLACLIEIFKQ